MNLDSFSRNSRSLVAFFIIICGFGILFSIIFWDFPSDQKDIYYSIAGVVGTLLGLVVSYYFGASKTETNHESNNSNTNK
jgi:glycopeptide antibiotics resistance protein